VLPVRCLPRWPAVLLAAALGVCPAAASDKPSPPNPPEPPRGSLPAPPSHPGLASGGDSAAPAQVSLTRAAVAGAEAVGFEGGGVTAVVAPGAPLRARILVAATEPVQQVVVRWNVDGVPVGETRIALRAGVQKLTSPPLPTSKPGRYVVDASVQGLPATPPATSYTVTGRTGPDRVERELVAVLAPEEGADRRTADHAGLVLVRSVVLQSTGEVLATYRVPEGTDPEEALRRLKSHPAVRSADHHTLLETSGGAGLRPLQYAPALIQLPAAQRWSTGKGVHVAVVDTSVDPDHPELRGKLGAPVDFTSGPRGPEVHGTAVAGVVVSSLELLGVAPDARVLPLRACAAVRPGGLDSRCRAEDVARAVDHAVRSGARVVNLSLGGPPDANLAWVVRRALEAGVLVVAAAGNGLPERSLPYPAALPGVVAVGATDRLDRRDPTSATGQFLSVVAPGVDVLTTAPNGRYVFVSGTSFAAAHVAGTGALVLSLAPSLAPLAVLTALQRAAVDLGKPGFDPEYGWGRLSACRTLFLVRPSVRCTAP